jgi:hypothetical protein
MDYKSFVNKFPENTKFVKLLNNDFNHYRFQYKIRLNEDAILY